MYRFMILIFILLFRICSADLCDEINVSIVQIAECYFKLFAYRFVRCLFKSFVKDEKFMYERQSEAT